MKSSDSSAGRTWRASLLAFLLLATLAAVVSLDPIVQPAAYHDFADRRALLGIPNLLDVASNLAFLLVGALGFGLCIGPRRPAQAASWGVLFSGVALTAIGSVYYHWSPNDATLVWDRLPMTLAFMALLVALVVEHIGEGLERYFLAPALALGMTSVLWWHWTGDLRLYLWVQYASVASLPFVLILFPARYTHRRYVLYGIGLYIVAKLAEIQDREIFTLTSHAISGHTMKHLLAAAAVSCLLLMLRRRAPVDAT